MKLWLCILSALLLAGCTAGTDVPGSVTPTAVPTPAATETGETAEVAATPAPRYGPRTHPVRKQKA